jgi:hypothetical protein
MAPVLDGKSIRPDQNTVLKEELLILRTKNGAMDQGTTVPNSRIQFASNESKLVPRKLDPLPSSKVGLRLCT